VRAFLDARVGQRQRPAPRLREMRSCAISP
jgi:hypothetical protein